MCEYCECRGVPPIGELMDEHNAVVDQAHHIRHDLGEGDPAPAMTRLMSLVADLDRHVRREEEGVFRAMRNAGEFVEEIDALENEHREFASVIDAIDPASPGFAPTVRQLLDDLDVHVEREDLGIFPVGGDARRDRVADSRRDPPQVAELPERPDARGRRSASRLSAFKS